MIHLDINLLLTNLRYFSTFCINSQSEVKKKIKMLSGDGHKIPKALNILKITILFGALKQYCFIKTSLQL